MKFLVGLGALRADMRENSMDDLCSLLTPAGELEVSMVDAQIMAIAKSVGCDAVAQPNSDEPVYRSRRPSTLWCTVGRSARLEC